MLGYLSANVDVLKSEQFSKALVKGKHELQYTYEVLKIGECVNNSLHLAQKYARIFVCRRYLFREANNFLRVQLEENCELRGTDNVQGQN